MGKTCAICGKPSGMYPLCSSCFKLRDEGKIVKCDQCGTWHYTDKPCSNCAPQNVVAVSDEEAANSSELTCLICGKPSNGKHFCISCYRKYKDRAVDLRIRHCAEVEILDEYGNLTIKCDDGRRVRSRAEALISNWLYKESIRSVYEKAVYYTDENGENKTLHPDFYLPDYNVFIEYNELTGKPYLSSKEYTHKIYESLGFKVLIMTQKELDDIEAFLKPCLGLH